MKIDVNANVLSCDEFKSKTGDKIFHNVQLLVDNLVFDFKFVKEDIYQICKSVGRLGTVKISISPFQSSIDDKGNNCYQFRLISCERVK